MGGGGLCRGADAAAILLGLFDCAASHENAVWERRRQQEEDIRRSRESGRSRRYRNRRYRSIL